MANSAPTLPALFFHPGFSRRTRVVLGVLALSWSCVAAQGAREPIRTYTRLILKDGRQLVAVKVVSYTANGILVQHSGGATVLPTKVLPEQVISDLRLSRLEAVETPSLDPAYLALADKPAVTADVLASTVPTAGTPVAIGPKIVATPGTAAAAHVSQTVASALPSVSNPTPAPASNAAPAPAGEGNIPEFFGAQTAIAPASGTSRTNISGRVVIALPSGETRFLEGVEVRAYPAALMESYLRDAGVRCQEASKKFLAQAEAATSEGRLVDAERLTARARKAATERLDYIPATPYVTRTDAFGHFTVRHEFPEVRLVAVGYATVAQEQWRYEWLGVTPDKEIILTEANATAVATPARQAPRFAAR